MTPTAIEPTTGQVSGLWMVIGIGAFFLFLGGGGYAVYTHFKQRGIRNNNPGNLRPSSDVWQGQSGIDDAGKQGKYLIFKGPEWGIRAMYKVLLTYRNKHQLTTIQQIITRWAPPSDDNKTAAYIASTAKALGKSATVPLALSDYRALLVYIIKHENGIQPYPDELITKGISLA